MHDRHKQDCHCPECLGKVTVWVKDVRMKAVMVPKGQTDLW